MKTSVLVVALGLLTGCQGGKFSENDVPVTVKDAFTKRFPSAQEVIWSKETESEYEAEFKVDGVEKSANFDQTGNWLVTETEVKPSDLPQAVQESITREFSGYEIEEAEMRETADRSFYEVELEKGETSMEVEISSDGTVLKKEEEKKEEGEKKD